MGDSGKAGIRRPGDPASRLSHPLRAGAAGGCSSDERRRSPGGYRSLTCPERHGNLRSRRDLCPRHPGHGRLNHAGRHCCCLQRRVALLLAPCSAVDIVCSVPCHAGLSVLRATYVRAASARIACPVASWKGPSPDSPTAAAVPLYSPSHQRSLRKGDVVHGRLDFNGNDAQSEQP